MCHEYKVKGLGLVIRLLIKIHHDVETGQKTIKLKLPGLNKTAKVLRAVPIFPIDGDFEKPDKVVVQKINIHGSFIAKIIASYGKLALVFVLFAFILVTIFLLAAENE